jgi:hypothetical protein
MSTVATEQVNGRPARLSPERLAELKRPALAKTPEEKRAALKRATEGLRVKVRVTPGHVRPPVGRWARQTGTRLGRVYILASLLTSARRARISR